MTYLSAQKAGFTGSYQDWVEAGRPAGGATGATVQQYTSFPKLTYTDFNNQKRTFDPNSTIQTQFTRRTGAGNQELQRPEYIVGRLSNVDNLLDPNFGTERRGYEVAGRGDVHFRNADDIDYSKFDDPELARQVLPAYLQAAQSIGSTLQQKASTDPAFTSAWQVGGQNARNELQRIITESQQEGLKNFNQYVSESQQDGGMTQVSPEQKAPYGLNPRTGEPLKSLQQAYAFARQDPDNKGMTWEDFKQEPIPFLEKADIEGIPAREPSMERPGEGTIAEQNKTGMPYPTWAAQQRAAGKPSSYQDWLSASAPPKEQPEAGVAEGVQAGQADGVPVTVGQDDNTTLALQQIDAALANGLLDQDTATLFKTVVRNWDVDKELNMDNVLKEFDEISESTISPYFAEQADIFKKDLQTAVSNLQQSRAEELEAQGIRQEEKIRGTREDLARRGLTFSEEAARQLGGKSAFGEKVPFGGERQVGEGLVPTEGRLIASGSQRAYQQAIDALGRQAETALGKEGVGSLVPGFAPRGVTQGSIAQKKQEAEANILSGLAGQERQLKEYQKPLDYNFTT